MDGQIGIRYKVDLERMLLDGSAEPTYLWLSLLEDITDCFSDDQQIGSGGFAVVYKGIVGERMVAVKKLSQTLDMHENKFHKEVECLMKAKHKNIVRFLGYCSDTQGRIANYEDSSGGLEWGERYQIIKGICEGLLHLHEKHILHLDLKPANILIDDRMVPKIADFGLSRCLDKDQTRAFTSHLCGSQGYLAPEFYRGQVAFFSDIYSLGVIIMEILTGEKGYPEDEYVRV
uniref:non-specific serine/threonine protein kinase n=1 Tax=Aegilops tauschii subsp. strangulata TaxID=200361 RepID=A0A453MUY4_AEGTS